VSVIKAAGRDLTVGVQLRDYQRQAIEGLHRAWRGEQRGTGSGVAGRAAVVLPTGAGKGHSIDTEVPTPSGIRRWGDLLVGDQIFGADGAPTVVTGVHDRGELPAYRVTMKHGESVLCDGDHLWRVERKGRAARTVSTQWLMRQPLKDRDGWCWSIPVAGAVQHLEAELPVDPYVIGSLIANGGMTHSGTVLTTPDPQVIARIRQTQSVTALKLYAGRTCPAYSLPGLAKITREFGMRCHSSQKRIPEKYLRGSVDQRIALLQGLMVGDGSVRHDHRRSLCYSTTSSGLADDMVQLITSLGGTCSIAKADRSNDGKPIEFGLNILLPVGLSAFDTDRKVAINPPRRTFHPRSAIISIEPAGTMSIRCISVAAPDHLYLVTRAHVVTHNTVIFTHPDLRAPIIGPDGARPRGRMLVLVHRDELATQAVAKLRGIDPSARVGRVQAAWNETDAQIIVASVQTLARSGRRDPIKDVALIVVDEAHHALAPTYLDVLGAFGAFGTPGRPGVPTAGFSATLSRSSEDEHLGDVWQEVVLQRDVLDGIRGGWLVDVKGKQVKLAGLDLRDVKRTGGDYSDGDLGEHLRAADAPDQVAQAYKELAGERQGVVFWPDVETASVGAQALTQAGIPAETVVGSTPTHERGGIYDRTRRGDVQVLSSCMVLTEGFDMPQLSCAVIARPTQSSALYVQMAGRVLRPHHLPVKGFAPKRDALLLDVVGIAGRHKLATIADLSITTKVAQVGEEESLRDAVDAETISETGVCPAAIDVDPVTGHRVVRDIDLFGDRASVWLQTHAGTWFVPCGNWTVFLWPSSVGGLWDVGVTPTRSPGGQASPVVGGLTLDWAMQQAERYARLVTSSTTGGARLDSRAASWRKSGKASDAQLHHARALGLHFDPETARKADVSDAISVAYATRALGG